MSKKVKDSTGMTWMGVVECPLCYDLDRRDPGQVYFDLAREEDYSGVKCTVLENTHFEGCEHSEADLLLDVTRPLGKRNYWDRLLDWAIDHMEGQYEPPERYDE